jgi:hypothetical protein
MWILRSHSKPPTLSRLTAEKSSWTRSNSLSNCWVDGKAYLWTASAETAVDGFGKMGIFPMNRHVFRENDFTIQEAKITTVEGQSSTSQANTDRSAQ